jgi:uridine phosphorylase
MIDKKEFPILEFDEAEVATLNPSSLREENFSTNKMIITFFPEVITRLIEEKQIILERTIQGENPVYIYKYVDSDILLTLGQVGCPACGGNLDLFNALGVNKVMFCGGGGVLDKTIEVGTILVVQGAIRDEGFSYHYVAPSRVIYSDEKIVNKISSFLSKKEIKYISGLTWTTDAIFRETKDRVALRRSEGAKIVEMEQAGCIAVAQFRKFDYGALIYGGDDVSSDEWDKREWRSRKGIRYDLVNLCKDLVDII